MTKDSIQSISDLIDGQMTDAKFNEEMERSRFLRECKKKGFEESKRLGLISKPVVERERTYIRFRGTTKENAIKSVDEINGLRASGMQAGEACLKVGVPYQTYADWASKLEMKFNGGRADYRKNQGLVK